MSVGGRVAYTRDTGDAIEVATWEERYPHDGYTCVQVEKSERSERIEPGNSFWWQQGTGYWTPKDRGLEDAKILLRTNSYCLPPKGGAA